MEPINLVVSRRGLIELTARSQVYRLLSQGFAYPDEKPVQSEGGVLALEIAKAIESLPHDYSLHIGFEELLKPLKSTASDHYKMLQEEHYHLFAPSASGGCQPYETEYDYPHIFAKAQELADISGFYHAFGLQVSSTSKERPDYLGTELEFMHILTLKEIYARLDALSEQATICRDAQRKFLQFHLGKWVPAFCGTLERTSSSGYYRALASLTSKFINCECSHLSIEPTRLRTSLPMVSKFEESTSPTDSCGTGATCW